MKIRKLSTLVSWVLAVSSVAACSVSEPAFLQRTISRDGIEARYQVYVPAGYTPAREWPVILFLHGAGERGTDGVQQTEVGLGPAVRQHPERFPSLVVFPQAPDGETWHGPAGRRALAALYTTIRELNGDPTRIYLVGLSMGGFGAWELAVEEPDRFAAIVTVSGGLAAPPPWDILNVPIDAEDPYGVVAPPERGAGLALPRSRRSGHSALRVAAAPCRVRAARISGALYRVRRRRAQGLGSGVWRNGSLVVALRAAATGRVGPGYELTHRSSAPPRSSR